MGLDLLLKHSYAAVVPCTRSYSNYDTYFDTPSGITPLMVAVEASQPEAVAKLLSYGADAWIGDMRGNTAVHKAAWQGNVECLTVLLSHTEKVEGQGMDYADR